MPASLADTPTVVWEVPLGKPGLGGIAATSTHLFFGDRDLDDFHDVYRCLDANTGEVHWEVQQLAIGQLDYGNSPRATPLVYGETVIFCGAFGDVVCVDIASGETIWQTNLRSRFKPAPEYPWGYCGSPLLVDEKLILMPGSPDAAVVALNPRDGTTVWTAPGIAAGYGSPISAIFGERTQIVGLDSKTIGGWAIDSGERLWTISPPYGGEFNVPTPINVDGKLLISTEQNGTRLFSVNANGIAQTEPIAQNSRLNPDMSSPVVVGDCLYCVNKFLYCLDVQDGLNEQWRIRDAALSDYASIIASPHRILVIGDGELLLLPADGEKTILSRQKIFSTTDRIYSHPALVQDRLFIRGETHLKCLSLTL